MTVDPRMQSEAITALLQVLSHIPVDGAFPVFISPAGSSPPREERYSAFFLAVALRALAGVPGAEEVRDRMATRLKGEASASGSWNYWLRASSGAKDMPYPDDLDTTSTALHALALHDPGYFTGDRLAAYVTLLLSVEVGREGPYATWIVPHARTGKDVDPVVNANVCALLSEEDITLPGLDQYLTQVLSSPSAISPFYPSRSAFLAFLSLAHREMFSARIRDEAWARLAYARDPLERALLSFALVHAEAPQEHLLFARDLLLTDVALGHAFLPSAFCLDRMKGGPPGVAGAKEVTAAFTAACLSAIPHAIEKLQKAKPEEAVLALSHEVRVRVLERFRGLAPALRTRAQEIIERLFFSDQRFEKHLFPYFVASSLEREGELPPEFLLSTCLAHSFGWIAYTLYDNVLDGDAEQTDLSVANVCLRECTARFVELVPPTLVQETMDRVDGANAWEMKYCRLQKQGNAFLFPVTLPDFRNGEKLLERPHTVTLSLSAVMSRLGFHHDAPETKAFLAYCRHYLLARKLRDDAGSWEADLKRGQLTMVNTDVLMRLKAKGCDVTPPDWMTRLAPDMQKLYWFETVEQICARIFSHVEEAGEACEGLPEVSRTFWRALVSQFAGSARKTLEDRDRTTAYLKAMRV